MAAIAAKQIGNLASEASQNCGHVATTVRSENEETFDTLDSQCSCAIYAIGVLRDEFFELVTSAFFPYLLVTLLLNIPPFAYGLASILSPDCSSSWLVYNAFLVSIHMCIAMYVVARIRGDRIQMKTVETETVDGVIESPYVKAEAERSKALACGEANSWDRIRVVMCYDLVMAVYYVICLVWVVWQGIGVNRVLDEQVDAACSREVVLSVVCGFLYMGLGLVAWVCSLCFLRYYSLQDRQHEASDKDIRVGDLVVSLA